jgi:hypothetical protein
MNGPLLLPVIHRLGMRSLDVPLEGTCEGLVMGVLYDMSRGMMPVAIFGLAASEGHVDY